MARYANLRLVAEDITTSRLPAGSFDFVLCSEVLEHIPDTAGVLVGIHRLLRPGGFVLLATPQGHSLMELARKVAFLPGVISLVRKIYQEPVFETGHINLQTDRGLKAALRANGFTIRDQFKSGLYLPLIAEFGGWRGLRLPRRIESHIRRGPLSFTLWTQYYLAHV